jgi:hypothetical protein
MLPQPAIARDVRKRPVAEVPIARERAGGQTLWFLAAPFSLVHHSALHVHRPFIRGLLKTSPSLAASGMAVMGKARAPARFSWETAMPIRRLATPAAYSPEQITILIDAHKAACAALAVEPADTMYSEAVALKILECAAQGEFASDRLCDYAVQAFRTNGS